MCHTLENEVTAKTTFKGKLDTYRFCDNVRSPLHSVSPLRQVAAARDCTPWGICQQAGEVAHW